MPEGPRRGSRRRIVRSCFRDSQPESHVAGAPEITVTAAVRKDFDADGVTDDAEIAAGTDPWDPSSF